MAYTPEQKAIQAKLDDLLDEFMRVHGSDGILTQYALCAHLAMAPNDEGDDVSSYHVVYRGGSAPDHVALGLFHTGIRFLERTRPNREMEDEG